MKKLLVVDDDEFDIMAFRRFFKRFKEIDLSTVKSLNEAEDKLNSEKFDVIICDYNLKDGNALELIEIKNNTPLIIISGVENNVLELNALSKGAYDFIVKDTKGDYLKILPSLITNAIERNKVELKMNENQNELLKIIEEKKHDN